MPRKQTAFRIFLEEICAEVQENDPSDETAQNREPRSSGRVVIQRKGYLRRPSDESVIRVAFGDSSTSILHQTCL
jgi:hypothetical protein